MAFGFYNRSKDDETLRQKYQHLTDISLKINIFFKCWFYS